MQIVSIVAIIGGIAAVGLPLLLSFLFGGQVSIYVSPPYGFNDIPDLTGTRLLTLRHDYPGFLKCALSLS